MTNSGKDPGVYLYLYSTFLDGICHLMKNCVVVECTLFF
jgi:hypothetical protein